MKLCCFPSAGGRRNNHIRGKSEAICTSVNVRLFSHNQLRSATGNFNYANKIGGGGFGVVYKGILRDGTQVAIKSLSAESKQGDHEFLTEIDMISNIKHPNLVQLIGCCIEGINRMLVYEYLENNSLANALFVQKRRRLDLDWPRRAAICLGTAHGLAFLHEEAEPHIVHRDIKASNVLLDKDFVPKIGDFGLAKLFPDNVTHISTRVAGTMGYLAPEYALLGQLTKKADIYSFGVLILEIVSGKSSTMAAWGEDLMVLVEWVWKLRDEGRILEIVDPELEYPESDVLRFIKVALFCTQATSLQRPSMKNVVEMLSKDISLDVKSLAAPRPLKTMDHSSGKTMDHSSSKTMDHGSSKTVNHSSSGSLQSSQLSKGKSSAEAYGFITSLDDSPINNTEMQPR